MSETSRFGAPAWMIGVTLLGGGGAVLLLASYGPLPPLRESWPLLVVLVGVAVFLLDLVRYLAFGGAVVALGLLIFLHNVETLDLARAWPWMLVILAFLVAVDRLLARVGGAGSETSEP